MIEEPEQLRTALNWDVALQIERAAAEFEAAWRKEGSTEIEQVLQKNSTIPSRELFCVLLETELELRRLNDETPDPQRWIERFPQWRREIEFILAQSLPGEFLAEDGATPLPRVGEDFGRYRIVKEIGRGAMGVVFQAEVIVGDVAPRLASDVVAIKVIRLSQSLSEAEQRDLARRFYIEASATSALKHPHVIPVYEVGDVQGVPYFTMPLIAGGTLKGLRSESPLNPVRAARIIEAAARALHHAHRSGVFHRDIKPSNILLGSADHVFVTDFGVSLHRDELGRGPGIAGTPLYMSPEQSAGKSDLVDGRSDVFSLGLVLYELLTGAHPFDSPLAASAEIIERICHVPVPPLRQRSDIPRLLEDICLKALRRQPEDRHSTAKDFADALAEFVESSTQPRPSVRSNRAALLAVVALALVVVGTILGLQMRSKPAPPIEQPPTVSDSDSGPSNIAVGDPNRIAAEWLLAQKQVFGTDGVKINLRLQNSWQNQWVVPGQALPNEPFRVLNLQAFHVPAITDAAVERYIAPLRDLEYLSLDHNRDVTFQTISPVAQLKQLKSLGLAGTKVTAKECVEIFSKLPSLTTISVSSDQFTDDMAEFVRTAPNVATVWLHNAREDQVRQLLAAKQLTQVVIFSTTFADSSVWQEIPQRWPNLETLGPTSTYLTDADLEEIARLPKLRELWLQGSTITDSGLLSLQDSPSLRLLNITKTSVTETSVRCFHTRLRQCKIIWDGGVIEPADVADPTRAAAEAAAVERLFDRLHAESNADILAALLLALGDYNKVQFASDRCSALQPLLVDWHEHSPSPSLHSAIEWLAKRWEFEASQSDATSEKPPSLADALRARRLVLEQKLVPRAGGWYQPMHGPTMVVVPSRSANPRTFAIATTEVTEQQFYYVHETHWLNPKPAQPDHPRTNVSWQEAAWFCNRLSELEGIPPVQQCYEQFTDERGEARLREKPNALDLPGYRLPTADEWEYVCRGATSGTLHKPNKFGVFDPQNETWTGNVGQAARLSDPSKSKNTKTDSFPTTAGEPPAATKVGIRIARTIPPAQVDPQRLVAVFVGPASHPDDHATNSANEAAAMSEADFLPFGENEIVSLGAWPRGRIKARRFRITNLMDQPVTVVKTYLGGPFDVRDPLPKTIAPRATVEFSIAVRDLCVGARSGDLVLTFKSGDREWKYFGKVSGNVHGTIMSVFEGGISGRDRSAMAFDFQTVPLNAKVIHGFGVHSQGDELLRIENIEVPDGFFLEPGWEAVVATLGGFRVRVDTTKTSDYSGRIRLRSNDPVEPVFEFPVHAKVSDSPRFSVIGVFRAGLWLFDHNRDGQADEEVLFGRAGDKPVTGDVNGDGICDIGICRPTSEGKLSWEFHLRGVKDQPPPKSYTFGKTSDVPFLSDPVGDGHFRPTVVGPNSDQRDLVWKFDTDGDGEENKQHSYLFGEAKATPVIGDWNGDGVSDPGSFLVGDAASQFQSRWKLRLGPKSWTDPPIHFGSILSIPVVGDWDADGRSQIGLMEFLGRDTGRVEFRLDAQSGSLPRLEVSFGRPGDVPVALSLASPRNP